MRSATLLVLAALAACAAPAPRKPIEEEPFVLSAVGTPPLTLGNGAPLPSAAHVGIPGHTAIQRIGLGQRVPIVVARLGGQATQLLVDTGAFDHVLDEWFARQLAFSSPTGRGATVIDHGNRRVGMDQMAKVTLDLDGWGEIGSIAPLATKDSNSGLQRLGIGGILSPQRLLAIGSVVIDFPGGSLSATDDAAAQRQVTAMPTSLGAAERCGGRYIIRAQVERHDARLLVDTGASNTDLRSSSPPGLALSGRSSASRESTGIGGALNTRVLSDAHVSIAQLARTMDVSVVEDRARRESCPSDGVLGMDVLASCVLAITGSRMQIGCK